MPEIIMEILRSMLKALDSSVLVLGSNFLTHEKTFLFHNIIYCID